MYVAVHTDGAESEVCLSCLSYTYNQASRVLTPNEFCIRIDELGKPAAS